MIRRKYNMPMVVCPKCGRKTEAGSVYCPKCGNKITAPKLKCPQCGSSAVKTEIFQENRGSISAGHSSWHANPILPVSHGILWWLVIGWWWRPLNWVFRLSASPIAGNSISGSTNITGYKKIFLCSDCGYSWEQKHRP